MKQKTIFYHVLGWLAVIGYDLVSIWRSAGVANVKVLMVLQLSFCLSLVAVFYYLFLWVFPQLLRKKRFVALVFALLAVPVVFSAVRFGLEQALYPLVFGFSNYYGHITVTSYLLDNLYQGVPVAVISAAIWNMQEQFRNQTENEALRRDKQEAELAFLRSQINPHFLYNTLNYIYSLAYPVSDDLANAVIKLSQLMRYALDQSADGKVDLQHEVDHLQNYIDIFRLRFGDQFNVEFKADTDLAGKRIASLMLIPFVENAFKHGVMNDPQRPVKIQLRMIGDRLMFTVSNKINHGPKDHSSGVGITNTRRRLTLLYPNKHELLIADNGRSYKTTLNVDL